MANSTDSACSYRLIVDLSASTRGLSFRAPAGLDKARWMAKSIYSLKIWMLKKHFELTKMEEKGIANICIFTVFLYVKAWFQAPHVPSATRTDLELLKDIVRYKEKNSEIAEITLKKLLGHLWYLSKELVACWLSKNIASAIQTGTKRH